MNYKLTRFAPSPTGALHLGHLVSALWVWAGARKYNSQIILRIEDHDRERCKAGYEDAMLQDLEALGFEWDHGPGASPSIYRQSDRQEYYLEQMRILAGQDLLFGCQCSRKDLESHRLDSGEILYPGTCIGQALETGLGIRMKIAQEIQIKWQALDGILHTASPWENCGALLLMDRKGLWTYQFCCSVDDYAQGVDLVIRGTDLLTSTPRQVYLQSHLGAVQSAHYFHHPLVCDANGRKLAKRDGDQSLREMLEQGQTPEQLIAQCLRLMRIEFNEKSIPLRDALEILSQQLP